MHQVQPSGNLRWTILKLLVLDRKRLDLFGINKSCIIIAQQILRTNNRQADLTKPRFVPSNQNADESSPLTHQNPSPPLSCRYYSTTAPDHSLLHNPLLILDGSARIPAGIGYVCYVGSRITPSRGRVCQHALRTWSRS